MSAASLSDSAADSNPGSKRRCTAIGLMTELHEAQGDSGGVQAMAAPRKQHCSGAQDDADAD